MAGIRIRTRIVNGQLALDLFGDHAADAEQAAAERNRREAWTRAHQIGQIRLPWDTADGRSAGELIPAWRCCACGGVETGAYALTISHGCEWRPDADGCDPHCPRARHRHSR